MTLRITRENGTCFHAMLRLEGRLVDEWAVLLERECTGLLRAYDTVSLDLTGVRFVDRTGVEALERLTRAGVEVRSCPGTVAGVLEGEGIQVEYDTDEEVTGMR